MRKWIIYSLVIVCCMSLIACSKDKTVTVNSGKVNQEKETYVYPLTGEKSNQPVDQRVIGVMINNHRLARPQSGISDADFVYEALAEGDITRFLAFFQSKKPEKVGPVRSARDYFIDLNNGFDAIYVHHGYSPEAKRMLDNHEADNLNGLNYDGTLFKRDSTRRAPHNSYITFDNIIKGAKENNYDVTDHISPLPFLTKKEVASIKGDPARVVRISYSTKGDNLVSFQYNDQTKKYERFSDHVKTVDRLNNRQVAVDNVMILEVPHQTIDQEGRRSLKLDGSGQGYLIQRGVAQYIEWKNVDGRLLPYKDGTPLKFVPGQTWVNIIPPTPGIAHSVQILNQ